MGRGAGGRRLGRRVPKNNFKISLRAVKCVALSLLSNQLVHDCQYAYDGAIYAKVYQLLSLHDIYHHLASKTACQERSHKKNAPEPFSPRTKLWKILMEIVNGRTLPIFLAIVMNKDLGHSISKKK